LGRYAKPPAHDSELKAAERRLSSPSSRRSAVEVYWPLSLFLPTVCLTQPDMEGQEQTPKLLDQVRNVLRLEVVDGGQLMVDS
jgi:hypothetical protein